MVAYLLLLVAVLSRVLPHAGWWNFTAVTVGLLYFGARRPWREMLVPLAALMATDGFLTIAVYHYSFRWQSYLITWVWYLAAMALGSILLRKQTTFARGAAGALLGPTDSQKAPKGTIRGDYGVDVMVNVVHASDSLQTAKVELVRFFLPGELFD